jgi:sec-independent protein translocase protein TatA
MSLGMTEIILILVVVLVLFGGKKIPELARGLGKAQAEYKKAKEAIENEVSEFKSEVEKASSEESKNKAPAKKTAAKKATKKSKK